jgi:hypothetical protein
MSDTIERSQTHATFVTEQGVHFDGLDTAETREEGYEGAARPARLVRRIRRLSLARGSCR